VIHLPDPEWDRIQALEDRVEELEERVAALQRERQSSGEGQNEAL
jgi:polyhydroxyalkanoate synthesis regulator phasin